MPSLGKTIRRYVTGLLALVLLGALWTTALGTISQRDNAVSLLTSAGTEALNPLLVNNGSGLGTSFYASLEASAVAHPSQPLAIAFVKPVVLGSAIAGKSYADGTAAIYHAVAQAYYDGGPGAAFSLPANLQNIVNTYTPFIQNAQSAAGQAAGQLPIPQLPFQLPSFAEPLWAATGISPTTLTASGHAFEMTWSQRFWLAGLVLGALLALFSAGWARLSSLGWALFHSAWHITTILLIATVVIYLNAAKAAPFRSILNTVGGAFLPVYLGATIGGLAVVGVATLLPKILAARAASPAPVPVAAGRVARGEPGAGAYPPGGYVPPMPGAPQPGRYPPATPGYPPEGAAGYPASEPAPHPYTPPAPQPNLPSSMAPDMPSVDPDAPTVP
jgi:hypothetical protein